MDASCEFYLREAFQNQTNTGRRKDIIQRESLGTDVIGTDEQPLHKISH